MTRIELLNHIQEEAVNSVINNGMKGTVNLATGVGKTITAFKFLYKIKKKFKKPKVWFVAETTTRKSTLLEESNKYEEIFGVNPLEDFDIEFYCYQGKPSGKVDIMILDEIHECLTKEYSKIFLNKAKAIIGLSATIPTHQLVDPADENSITKGELLDKEVPIVYKYNLEQAVENGILSPYQTTIIKHQLDNKDAYISGKLKGKATMLTEYRQYGKYKWMLGNFNLPSKVRGFAGRNMSTMLHNLKSKVQVTKDLLSTLEGKTIIFGVRLGILEMITPNVIRGGGKKQEIINESLLNKFNNDEINIIASAKKLKQGKTLKGVENCIIVSYYKELHHLVQQLGRVIRFVPDKMANLYIIETENTFETKWLNKLTELKDLNITKYQNSKFYANKAKSNSTRKNN